MTIYGWSEELVSRCVECNLAEPESLVSLGGSAPRLVDGILSLSTMNKIRMFTSWMGPKMTDGFFELYAENLLSLTREQFNDFKQADMIRMMAKTSSPQPGPTTPMTTLSGYTKATISSESQVFSITSRRVPREMHQNIPFLGMTSIMTPSRDPSWLLSRPKVFMMLLTQILILMMEISMINNSFKKNNLLCIPHWLLLS